MGWFLNRNETMSVSTTRRLMPLGRTYLSFRAPATRAAQQENIQFVRLQARNLHAEAITSATGPLPCWAMSSSKVGLASKFCRGSLDFMRAAHAQYNNVA